MPRCFVHDVAVWLGVVSWMLQSGLVWFVGCCNLNWCG